MSASIVNTLRAAGCVFAEDEARLLIASAGTAAELDAMVQQRVRGLPLEQIVGWAAASCVSKRDCYAGVAESSVYVGEGFRGRGVGKALLHKQVTVADTAGLWTLQTSIFPENRAGIALHHAAGFRTLGVRERIATHHGAWRDTVFLERRRAN